MYACDFFAGKDKDMFTGIIEELGVVDDITPLADDAARIRVRGPLVTSDARHGDSIAVNGVCLTVVETSNGVFSADVMRETLQRSSLGALYAGSKVNLERPMTLSARLGGHLVQGHVDGVATILGRTSSEHWDVVEISLPAELAKYVVEKGSITVDGISLTVASVSTESFTVSLIPTTLQMTTLGFAQISTKVNLEVDVIAKYVERMIGERS